MRCFSKVLAIILLAVLMVGSITYTVAAQQQGARFSDVPAGNWADGPIHEARDKNITEGLGNNIFGYGLPVKRSEFVKFLTGLLGWELVNPAAGSFSDNLDTSSWYYKYIETALSHGVISRDETRFRPLDNITREEMAVMLVRSLGLDALALRFNSQGSTFPDVTGNAGYISIARDFGIVTGKNVNGVLRFEPKSPATREEAIVMLMRLYDRLYHKIDELHAFYAISSYSQLDLINGLDSVSFGWSSLYYDPSRKDVFLNMKQVPGNDFFRPEASNEPFAAAGKAGAARNLMVYVSQEQTVIDEATGKATGLAEFAMSDQSRRTRLIDEIISALDGTGTDDAVTGGQVFDGVVIDFEELGGEAQSSLLNTFLQELKARLGKKALIVAVHPRRSTNQAYYDGYDYRTIGDIADKVILMAHDYYSTALTQQEMDSGYNDTPLSPADEVYYALKSATDKATGIQDPKKIYLQISFDTVQWKMQNGKIINKTAFRPSYDQLLRRLNSSEGTGDLKMNYNADLDYAWVTFFNTQDNTDNIIWYEDSRSVAAKVRLASLFGVNGISLWRLGNIPSNAGSGENKLFLDVWQQLSSLRNR